MNKVILAPDEVLRGYDAVSTLYPHVPSLSHWRAWEFAAYRHFDLKGRCLDLGCGDGRYFRLLWPGLTETVGVEIDPIVADLGAKSGVYEHVHVTAASALPEPDDSFDHVFANCSLEHMDELDAVLQQVERCLKSDGTLLCSVVTQRFIEWSLLPRFVTMTGHGDVAAALEREFLGYHHLANPLPVTQWIERFEAAGLTVESHIPILPEYNSGIFLLMDSLWHLKKVDGGELGDVIHPFLSRNSRFPKGLRSVIAGLLDMEIDPFDCSGAVFSVRKRSRSA